MNKKFIVFSILVFIFLASSSVTAQSRRFSLRGTLFHDNDDLIKSVAFSPDSSILATGASPSGKIRLWDVRTETVLHKINNIKSIQDIAFSPDGKLLASIDYDYSLKLWDVQTGKLKQRLIGKTKPSGIVVFSPDGKMLATEGFIESVLLWNTQTGKLIKNLLELTGR